MTLAKLPVLYSFRRCPYAMRARMGLYLSAIQCELREVVLKDKPQKMLEISPKGTVPVLVVPLAQMIDESLEIMLWALRQNDEHKLLEPLKGGFASMMALINTNDTAFKFNLDRYKYPNRYQNHAPCDHRRQGETFLAELEHRLKSSEYLCGDRLSLADLAIGPFVRQFANVDKAWFKETPYDQVQRWLDEFIDQDLFGVIMKKYAPWRQGDVPIQFGAPH